MNAHISDSQEKAATGKALLTWPVKKVNRIATFVALKLAIFVIRSHNTF